MPNLTELSFALLNAGFSAAILGLVVRSLAHFRGRLLTRLLKVVFLTGAFLMLFFATEALIALEILPVHSSLDDILDTLFTLGLLYLVYGLIREIEIETPILKELAKVLTENQEQKPTDSR